MHRDRGRAHFGFSSITYVFDFFISYKIIPCLQRSTGRIYDNCAGVWSSHGRAIAQVVSRWLPTVAAQGSIPGLVMWDLWWTKWHRGRFSPSTLVSPANLHSTNCSTIILIYHLGFVQQARSGRSTRDLVPPHQ
jgi:hypothetical protein